jgi:hypothetical protein
VWGVRRVHLRSAGLAKQPSRLAWPQLIRPRIDRFPMLWKELFAEKAVAQMGVLGRIVVLLIIAGVLVPTGVMYATSSTVGRDEFLYFAIMLGTVIGCAGLLLVGARSATSITSEKERDTWMTLLSTPLEPVEIVAAKVLGNLYAARVVAGMLLVIWGLATYRDVSFAAAAAISGCVLLLGAVCVSLMGLLFSNWCTTSQRAMACTVGLMVFLGGGYLFLFLPLMAGGPDPSAIVFAPCPPFLLTFPAIAVVESRNQEEELIAAFVLGIIGYSILTLILWTLAVANFNHMAGRTDVNVFVPTALGQPGDTRSLKRLGGRGDGTR